MCNGIDDGYSNGVTLDPDPESTKVIVIGSDSTGFTIAESDRNYEVVVVDDSRALITEDENRSRKDRACNQFMAMALGTLAGAGYQLPYALRKPAKPKKPCLLPGCQNTTSHNRGYCCADHCREHRGR